MTAARARKSVAPDFETRGDAGVDEPDGRRRRSNSSRVRIVDAMLKLVRDGDVAPGAARVAEMAGVGLRTVFRHFDDMDSLYREMAELLQSRVLPAVFRPYGASDWRGQLEEMIERRIELYEAIFPYKVSAEIKRFHSPYVMGDYRRHLQLEKASLESVLPPGMVRDRELFEALRAATGFQAWRILRRDQDLSVDKARRALLRAVEALLASHAGPAAARVGSKAAPPRRVPATKRKT